MKHSPTPWTKRDGTRSFFIHSTASTGETRYIAELDDDLQGLEDASHILHCVNSHDALVAALESVLSIGEHIDLSQGITMERIFSSKFKSARAVLQQAKEAQK